MFAPLGRASQVPIQRPTTSTQPDHEHSGPAEQRLGGGGDSAVPHLPSWRPTIVAASSRSSSRARQRAQERPLGRSACTRWRGTPVRRFGRTCGCPVDGIAGTGVVPATAWIIPGVFLCVALVILGIGVAQFMGSHDGSRAPTQATRGDWLRTRQAIRDAGRSPRREQRRR